MILRAYREEDLTDLHALDARCFPPPIGYTRAELRYFLLHPRNETYIAEEAGHVAGFCIVDWKMQAGRRIGHYITIDVEPERRRAGIGRQLMLAAEAYLKGLGCVGITLEVGTQNAEALAFYTRLGYEAVGEIPGYYADGMDALVMRKVLVVAS